MAAVVVVDWRCWVAWSPRLPWLWRLRFPHRGNCCYPPHSVTRRGGAPGRRLDGAGRLQHAIGCRPRSSTSCRRPWAAIPLLRRPSEEAGPGRRRGSGPESAGAGGRSAAGLPVEPTTCQSRPKVCRTERRELKSAPTYPRRPERGDCALPSVTLAAGSVTSQARFPCLGGWSRASPIPGKVTASPRRYLGRADGGKVSGRTISKGQPQFVSDLTAAAGLSFPKR